MLIRSFQVTAVTTSALWILCIAPALALHSLPVPADVIVSSIGTPFEPTEDLAAADIIGYHPDPNAASTNIQVSAGKVSVIKVVPPTQWFPKYTAMREWALQHGIAQAKHPDDGDMVWIVELQLPDGSKVWTTSSAVWIPCLGGDLSNESHAPTKDCKQ